MKNMNKLLLCMALVPVYVHNSRQKILDPQTYA